MPAFNAINLEPEDNVDEEIDNTRGIQIEEALKRFQTALKLHAQGPAHYDEAAEAYQHLFKSEIFQYPDSATDFERAERQTDPTHLPLDLSFAQDAAQADIDGSGSSLPQALYLAYKNFGQFELDVIKHLARSEGSDVFERKETLEKAHRALYNLSAALDHDPSDADLWRRAARVAVFLKSARTSRYCLEAAIELDDDPTVDEVEPPSLAEGFAGEELKEQLKVLGDDVALTHPILGPFVKRSLPAQLKKYTDPIPFLPNPIQALAVPKQQENSNEEKSSRAIIEVTGPSWADLGMALVHFVAISGVPANAISIDLPEIPDTPEPMQQSLVERPKPQDSEPAEVQADDTVEVPSQIEATEESESPKETRTEVVAAAENSLVDRASSIVSRKRSQSTAGFPDGDAEEVVEKRSKRTRRRETAGEETMDTQSLYAAQLEPLQAADKHLFQTTRNMVENLAVADRGMLDRLAEIVELSAIETRTAKVTQPSMTDLRDSLANFDEDVGRILLAKKEESSIGFNSFLEHSKPSPQSKTETRLFDDTKGLKAFAQSINSSWVCVQDISFEWVKALSSTYLDSKWSDAMKTAVVQVISHLDEDILNRMQYDLEQCKSLENPDDALLAIDQMVQMLFELHLDIYERITNPNSIVDLGIRVETKGRVRRWFSFASSMSRERPDHFDKTLSVRFLWAAVFSITLTEREHVSRDHILHCWQSLRETLAADYEDINLRLPNNAIMPEISIFAADREISKLTTMDFFLGIFQGDLSDPVSVIENLEPVLNPISVFVDTDLQKATSPPTASPAPSDQAKSPAPEDERLPITETASQGLRDLWKFLLGASTELRLFLWTRLGEAYEAIQYPTKHFSCKLRSIEMVVNDFERNPYLSMPTEERRGLAIKMFKFLDDLLVQSLSIALNDSSAFDIIDDDHLKSSVAALTKLSCILHTSSMYEDEARVGMCSAPSNNANFSSFLNKLREMQVRNWSLLYTLLKTGVLQNKEVFSTPETHLADYLAAVHQVLGLRKFCKSSNKIFLKMMRVELLKQNLIDNWEDYLGQVLFDLYGLKLGVGIWEVQDHGCPPEKLESRNTVALVEKISVLANRMPMKDLLKSDLKTTIEHMQQAIGQTKSNQQTIHNLRNFNEYLKRPIHPLRLYQALNGNVTIDAVAVNTADSALAKHGWFFLHGMIAFCKFKGVDLNRRQTPGATDDLRIGATFLRQQLQFTPDRWDAWFRLAECFDYELDESVLWTADKMNKERAELVKYQRNAIHCYTLALSHSWKAQPEADGEASEAIHELYHKFGMRMYASSREPFAMEPFQHADHERFFIQNMGGGTFKRVVHEQMEDYKVWKYAAGLFRRAMAAKPKEWKNSYMYAKCIWKMYQKPYTSLDQKDRQNRPSVEAVIEALEKAVEVVSKLPKPRSGDTILEPHYKIVSVIHKLVVQGDLEAQEAIDILQRQPLAVRKGSRIEINDPEDYEPFIIETLTHLREKDRSNWQHRIIMRHARILFDESSEDPSYIQAMAAFGVLQKSMFTKTMVMNVWKCDAERPGRHHVYTEQYVRFMVKLLVVLKDRSNFEALLRRIRKKGADFYHFNDLWQTCCMAYLRLIRQTFQVEPILEDVFKNVSAEEFEIIAGRISDWAAETNGTETGDAGPNKAFAALKDAIELKKLNAGLMKVGPIDDLIIDSYTAIYLDVGTSLPGPTPSTIIQERALAKIKDEQMLVDDAADSKPTNPFSNILNPQSEQNSGTEGPGGNEKEKDKEKEGVTSRPRRAGVRRPDILRKAEQAVVRALEGPSRPANGTKSLRNSVSSGKTRASGTPHEGDAEKDGDVVMKEGAEEEGGHESSAPGSVHDDADDESDLSDVPPEYLLDEDEEAQLMFPGLISRRSVDQEVQSSDDDEEEEEEEEDEAEEEEEHEEQEGGGEDVEREEDHDANEVDDESLHEDHDEDNQDSEAGDEDGDVDMADPESVEVADSEEEADGDTEEEEEPSEDVIEAAGVPLRRL